MKNHESKFSVLRNLPAIDKLLQSETSLELVGAAGTKHLTGLARLVTETLRNEIHVALDSEAENEIPAYTADQLMREAETRLRDAWKQEQRTRIGRVINATGVIIHTNLGRAPLSEEARTRGIEEATRYCNLEYNVATGKRGRRGARAEHLLAVITGAESGLIVNNCAAACVLVLTALAKGGESIISRGELVEIGGDFRVPDVMEQSGTKLVEVGTTNKTKASDYERAITEKTRLITRVHPSNYRIVGFTSRPSVNDLADIAHKHGLLLYEDAGSGAIVDMSKYGLADEPVISESVKAGADVVTFSGDKLIGGIQAGLIVGKGEVIAAIRKNPLYRALRVSKIVYSILERTFETFRRGDLFEEIPVLRMLSMTDSDVREKTRKFQEKLEDRLGQNSRLKLEIGEGRSVIGGGSAPTVQPPTALLSVRHEKFSAGEIEKRLRLSSPPVICRVYEERVAMDLRTVLPDEEDLLIDVLAGLDD